MFGRLDPADLVRDAKAPRYVAGDSAGNPTQTSIPAIQIIWAQTAPTVFS